MLFSPSPVKFSLTHAPNSTFLFGAVAVSGIRIISTVPFTRRTRFVLTASMSVGFGAILVPKCVTPRPPDLPCPPTY